MTKMANKNKKPITYKNFKKAHLVCSIAPRSDGQPTGLKPSLALGCVVFFGISNFVLRICFVLRISNFEFSIALIDRQDEILLTCASRISALFIFP